MAGSLQHVMSDIDLIENLGDAKEAIGEMLWLILHTLGEPRANELLVDKFYPMNRGEIREDKSYKVVQKIINGEK